MQVIGNPSTDVPRHAAVVEAGLINKKMVLRVTVKIYAAVTHGFICIRLFGQSPAIILIRILQ